MPYQFIIIADSHVCRFWEAAQVARPQLVGVGLKPARCMDTLASSLSDTNDGLDFVIVSVLTDLLHEEASASDLKGSSSNIIGDVVKLICGAAKKSSRVEVCFILSIHSLIDTLTL